MKQNHEEVSEQVFLVKRIGTFGFMFFLIKGILWITIPLIMAYLGLGEN